MHSTGLAAYYPIWQPSQIRLSPVFIPLALTLAGIASPSLSVNPLLPSVPSVPLRSRPPPLRAHNLADVWRNCEFFWGGRNCPLRKKCAWNKHCVKPRSHHTSSSSAHVQTNESVHTARSAVCNSLPTTVLNNIDSVAVFTARCYASAVLAMGLCLCLCLCVCHKSEFY